MSRPEAAYYLNMPARTERRTFMERQMALLKMPLHRYEGETPVNAGGFMNCAARGNFMSHYMMILHSTYESYPVLILEDDAEIMDHELFNQVSLPVVPWDVFYYHGGPGRLFDTWDTHAYVVNKNFAPLLLELMMNYMVKVDREKPRDSSTYVDQFFMLLQNAYIFIGYPVIRQRPDNISDTGWGRYASCNG